MGSHSKSVGPKRPKTVRRRRAVRARSQDSDVILQHPDGAVLRRAILRSDPSSPADLLALQRLAGNTAVQHLTQPSTALDQLAHEDQGDGGVVQANGQGRLSDDEVNAKVTEVFNAWVRTIAASRGLPKNNLDVISAALARTAHQVGPVMFERYQNYGGTKGMESALAAMDETAEEEEADPMGELYHRMRVRARSLNTAATKLNSSVVQAEYFTHMLKSPEGAKGIAYQITAGVMGIGAAIIHGLDYAKKIPDPKGAAIDKSMDFVIGKLIGKEPKPKPTFTEKADEFGQTAGTSVELMTGQLNKLYQQTRPSYSAYQKALVAFGDARSAYWSANDLPTLSEQLGQMKTHLEAMSAAALQYLMKCDVLGIRQKAAAYAALDKAVIDAHGVAVTSAVEGGVGGLTSAPADLIKNAAEKAIK